MTENVEIGIRLFIFIIIFFIFKGAAVYFRITSLTVVTSGKYKCIAASKTRTANLIPLSKYFLKMTFVYTH